MDKLKSNIENQRPQLGLLKFSNNRSYPIYEGINVIGRDIKATIRVKDLTFSKQHAIISVINDSTCFISDFDSSNGTHVRDMKLEPFKLYQIKNLDTIIFGDIIASYHTTITQQLSVEQDDTIANESQIAATQILPQNLHDISTQKIDNKKVHFEETQLVHDAETQLTTNDDQPICSKTTGDQIPIEVNLNASEIFDDVFANETFRQSLHNPKYDIVVDETIPNDSKLNHNVSLEDDDIILSTQDNDMIDKQAMELQQNRNASKETENIVHTDDSETDIENEEKFIKNIKDKSTQVYNIVKDSDSETDIEDNEIKTSVNNPIVKKEVSDDEEELDLLSENIHSNSPNINDGDDDDLLLVPTQLLQNKKSNDEGLLASSSKKKRIESDNDDDLLAPTQLLSANNHEKKANYEDDMDSLAPTQLLSTKNVGKVMEIDNDDDLLEPTQLLTSKTRNDQVDNDMLAPTQLLSSNNNQKKLSDNDDMNLLARAQLLSSKNAEKVIESDADDDLLAPTQLLSAKNNQNVVDDLAPTQLLLQNNNYNEDEMLAPTQLLEPRSNKKLMESDVDDLLAPTQLLQSNNQNDSIFSAPTQLLDKKTFKRSCILDTKSPKNKERKIVNFSENIFDAPTQKLEPQNKPVVDIPPIEKDSQSSGSSSRSNTTNNSQDLRLVLSETDDEIICEKVPQNTEPETQLEVDFQLETQKIYVEQKTSRPDNPLGQMFDEEPTQMTEDMEDKKELPDIEAKRKLQIKLQDIKDLIESSSSKSTTSDENEFKAENRKTRRCKAKTDNKLNIMKDKSKLEVEEKKVPISTRGRRTSLIKTEIKKTRVSEIKKTARLSIQIVNKYENSSDMDDFVQRETRNSKRGHGLSKKDTEDDSEEIISPKKKVKKLEYTQDDNSNSSEDLIHEKQTRKSKKIEDYSSDENSNNTITSSIYINTPNTKRRRFDPLNVTVNESMKHKIVFTMLNNAELENSVKKLGGSIIDNVNMCTVLVTNKISRSLKFLIAVALGKPIVQPKWILDSVKKNSFQDPWNYILEDKETESKYKFSLKESLKKSCEKKLLTDLVILIATKKNTDVLKAIIETSGGKCIQRAPAKNGNAIVVSYEDEKSKYSRYLKQKSLTVVAAEAIFAGVLQQELKLNEHLLI